MKNCQKVIVIKNPSNFGCARAWNQGMQVSLTDYMLITNNDILFDVDCIDNLLITNRENNGLVSANHEDKRDGSDKQVFWSCFMLTKSMIDKVGYFDEFFFPARGEDLEMGLRMDVYGINRDRIFNAKVIHEHNGTAKNLEGGSEWKHHNWAGTMGRNLSYYEAKKKRWGY